MATIYTFEGKKAFGQWLARHRSDTRLWPDSLYGWADAKGLFGPGQERLSILKLVEWLEQQTGYALTKDTSASTSIRKMEEWGTAVNPKLVGGKPDAVTLNAFHLTEYLSVPGVKPRRPMHFDEMLQVMTGRLILTPEGLQSSD